ncbi:MAG: hypothetical protein ACYDBH_18725, partial [Acidobacteriaceae bacterium]
VAIRIRPRQEELFADGSQVKHFAVLSNLWEWTPERLRFLIINTAARLVQHARKMRLRLATLEERITLWKEALRLLPVAT